MRWIILAVLLAGFASGACIEASDGMIIKESVLFCSSTHDIPNGITIAADNVVVDCGTAVLRGTVGQSEIGIKAENVDNIVVRNCNIITFNQGLYLKNVTNSLVENNAFLKNRIGVRLLDSFENTIRDNSDKSFQVAVSAINSKFNVVMLGNKEVERSFCEENACNEFRDMNVCVSNDFYCSKKCTASSDSDCGSPVVEEKPPVEPVKSAEEIIEEAEESVERLVVDEPAVVEDSKSLPLPVKVLVYVVFYVIALLVLSLKKR